MIALGYPSVLRALNTARREGQQPYVVGSACTTFLYRRSRIAIKPKTGVATSEGSPSRTAWSVAGLMVQVVSRSHRRTVEE
jgi:hypothetical protein